MGLQRKETASTSSSRRKNENRTHATKNRRRMGGRVDGVLRRERNWEYLVIEAAKHLKDASQDTKHLKDYFKLARNLRDML